MILIPILEKFGSQSFVMSIEISKITWHSYKPNVGKYIHRK